ncbi:TonB family protein [Catalinimonas niigatensis]|uniref:TonB family protein n=1 Tax=Catalinimonas niigatensis TaxID=1397264 RepID=UPI0026654B7C|nr:TonB family protein [Catalinimonas niigatensis]WPP51344.1 TonB family protein [Catalinimonas niigatensis]
MSKLHHDSDRLSMELMKKFRDGTLSAEEEARLNALQTQDPFIADALEGMAEVKDGNAFAKDVDELRGRIQQRTRSTKSLSVYWLPVAASLVLLIGVFYAVYTYVQPSDISALTSKESNSASSVPEESAEVSNGLSPISALPPQDLADTPSPDEDQSPQSLAMVQLPSRKIASPSAMLNESAPESITESSAGSTAQADEAPQIVSEVEEESFDENFTLAKRKATKAEEQKLPTDAYSARSKAATAPFAMAPDTEGYTISGKVIDQESGEAVPGANVLVKGTAIGAITDVAGNFSISLAEKHKELLISSIGYENSEATISQEDTMLIALNQDIQMLSEVVVVGYGVQERRDVTGSVSTVGENEIANTTVSAQPQEGMRAFKQYLSENQRFPEDWKDEDKAVVKLSFFVQPNGKLTDFTIEKSAGTWLDQEAIRLIQEGPAWKAATRNEQAIGQEVKLRVRFKK